jgi:hypothetical protein
MAEPITAQIKREADALLYEQGLLASVQALGPTFVGGSYAYNLLCWRDLDLYVLAPDVTLGQFFALGARITHQFAAHKAFFTDNRAHAPAGLYWGIRLGDTRKGAWKFDIWALGEAEYTRTIHEAIALASQLTAQQREVIVALKLAYWNTPQYRDTITSALIYEAVVQHGVTSRDAFEQFVEAQKHR